MRTKKWPRLKSFVCHRDGWRCQYCGVHLSRVAATLDHLTPKAMGGSSLASNLVAACLGCNQLKADALPLEFLWVVGVRFQGPPRRRPTPPRPQPKPNWYHPRLSTIATGATAG